MRHCNPVRKGSLPGLGKRNERECAEPEVMALAADSQPLNPGLRLAHYLEKNLANTTQVYPGNAEREQRETKKPHNPLFIGVMWL